MKVAELVGIAFNQMRFLKKTSVNYSLGCSGGLLSDLRFVLFKSD